MLLIAPRGVISCFDLSTLTTMSHILLSPTDTLIFNDTTLYRVHAAVDLPVHGVNRGDRGGWAARAYNDQESAWIADEAKVYDDAVVSGQAIVRDEATVWGAAHVKEQAIISGNADIYDQAIVTSAAHVAECAEVFGRACVSGNAMVTGSTWVSGSALVTDASVITGGVSISGLMRIGGEAVITDPGDVCAVSFGAPTDAHITLHRTKTGHLIHDDSWSGTLDDFQLQRLTGTLSKPQALNLINFLRSHMSQW